MVVKEAGNFLEINRLSVTSAKAVAAGQTGKRRNSAFLSLVCPNKQAEKAFVRVIVVCK